MRNKIVLFLLMTGLCLAQSPVINEVMSLNVAALADDDGDYSDWLEIYNPSPAAINLNGYGLSDDKVMPLKWIFPDRQLAPGDFLLVYASDKNRRTAGALHLNFKIKSKGERLYLASPAGAILDSLAVPPLAVDVSYGRSPDAAATWAYFVAPTPGARNNTPPATGYAEPPRFSPSGGLYPAPVSLELSSVAAAIRYTTDGSDPSQNSPVYQSPIRLAKTTVFKARVFENGKLPSPAVTHTFFINEQSGIALVSMSTHPDNLFDDDIGIYVVGNGTALGGYESNPLGPPANFWEDWERPVHLELYEPDGRGFSTNAGIKMAGKTTRLLPQKSFAVFLRSQYGANELNYPLFPDYTVHRFKSFVLRNGGSDNTVNQGGVQFRDGLTALLLRDIDLDDQMYRPCHLYINGEYWGIYNIRERLNEDYLAAHHGVDPKRVDILDDYHTLYPLVIEGSADHFNALIDYLDAHDLRNDSYAAFVETQMDVDNYLTYMAVQIFYANHDGPGHNCKFWRAQDGGRYRWLLYDTDHSLGMRLFIPNFHYAPDAYLDNTIAYYREENGPSWPNPPESTFLFRKILENENFTHIFINKLADFMNSIFREEKTLATFAVAAEKIEPEISKHLVRWGGSKSAWTQNVTVVEDFLINRAVYLQDHVINEFDLGGLAEITINIDPANAGQILLNSLYTKENWSGVYFQDVPVQLTALPNIGYHFAGWDGAASSGAKIAFTPTGDATITARFEKAAKTDVVVINEINYNSPADFDTEDWIELYNPLSTRIDLSNWVLADFGQNYTFPPNTIIEPNGFLVIARDVVAFKKHWPHVNATGNLPFGMSSAGDFLSLTNSQLQIVDSLTFKSSSPWPWQPNGAGATLALRDPNFDNTKAENWLASFDNGTPGHANQIIGAVRQNNQPKDFMLKNAYPNPFNATTTIEFYLPQMEYAQLKIYDILGRRVKTLVEENLAPGQHRIKWNATDDIDRRVASGIYLVRFESANRQLVQKIALVY